MAGFSTCTEGDPKFWPLPIKLLILFNVSLSTFMGNMYSAGISTGFAALAIEFKVSFLECTKQISWSVLALGLSSIMFMPLALCIGKRPTVLIALFINLAGCIWSTQATTFDSLLGSRILGAIGGGAIETIGPSIISDIFTERYFATGMAVFTSSLSAGVIFGPLIAGYVVEDYGWRSFFVICTAIVALNILTVLFFMPETSYRRTIYHGETAAELDKEAVDQHLEHVEKSGIEQTVHHMAENPNTPYAGTYWKDLVSFSDRSFDKRGLKSYPRRFVNPLRFLIVPQVLFAAGAFGLIVSGVVLISALQPNFLAPPPYLFTSAQIGLTNLASLVGIVLAYPIGGPATDYISKLMRSRRPSGSHRPEDRMPALLVPFIICPCGLVVFGIMLAHHQAYVKVGCGFAMQAAGQVLVPSVVLSYIVDAYPEQGGEALVLVNAVKNVLAFAFTEASVSWLARDGLQSLFLEFAGIQWAILALALPLYFAGPWLRAKMANLAY